MSVAAKSAADAIAAMAITGRATAAADSPEVDDGIGIHVKGGSIERGNLGSNFRTKKKFVLNFEALQKLLRKGLYCRIYHTTFG